MIGRFAERGKGLLTSVPSWLWWAYAGATLLYTVPPVFLYFFYRQPSFDLGIYDQTIWLLAHGGTFNTVAGIHVFGAHFSPILYLLTPLALIPGGAVPELVFEGLWMATCVFPVYLISKHLERSPRPLVLLAVIHPGVFAAAWWGMRPWNLAYPFLLWATFAILRRPRWSTITVAGLGALTLREDIGLWVGLIAVVLALAGRVPWRDVFVAGIPIGAATLVIVTVVLPAFSPIGDYLYSTIATGDEFIPLSHQVLMTAGRGVFLLAPIGLRFQSFRGARWPLLVPALVPVIGLARLGSASLTFSLQYDLLLVGLITLWLALSPKVELDGKRVLISSILIAGLMGTLSPTSPDLGPNPFGINATDASDYNRLETQLAPLIKQDTSLSLPDPLVAHYSERPQVFQFPYPFDSPQREPYPMDCPPPRVVAVDRSEERADTPGWEHARGSSYNEQWRDDRFSIYVLSASAPAGDCGPSVDGTNGR